jgi:hypothetical protein
MIHVAERRSECEAARMRSEAEYRIKYPKIVESLNANREPLAARGVPIMATSRTAPQFGWTRGEELVMALVADPEKFAGQCHRFYSHPELCLSLARAGACTRAGRLQRHPSSGHSKDYLSRASERLPERCHSTHPARTPDRCDFQLIEDFPTLRSKR